MGRDIPRGDQAPSPPASPWLTALVAAPRWCTSPGQTWSSRTSDVPATGRGVTPQHRPGPAGGCRNPRTLQPMEPLVINRPINPAEHDSLIIVTSFTFFRIIPYYINIYFSVTGRAVSWVMFKVLQGGSGGDAGLLLPGAGGTERVSVPLPSSSSPPCRDRCVGWEVAVLPVSPAVCTVPRGRLG